MIVHLGRRVSALLDGQLSPSETERAWQHVHVCHPCRDIVEIEGRIKTQLARLAQDQDERDAVPSYLKGSLLGGISAMTPIQPERPDFAGRRSQQRTTAALIGTGALSMAMLGTFAVSALLSQTSSDRRLPISDLSVSTSPRPAPSTGGSIQNIGVETQPRPVTARTVAPARPSQRVRAGQHLVLTSVHAVK